MTIGALTIIHSNGNQTTTPVHEMITVLEGAGLVVDALCASAYMRAAPDKSESLERVKCKEFDTVNLTKAFRENNGTLIVALDETSSPAQITVLPEHNNMSWLPKNGC